MSGADGRDPTALAVPYTEAGTGAPRIAFHTAGADADVSRVVRGAAAVLDAVEARPACLDAAYDLEMKLIGADGGDSLRAYLAAIGSHTVHPLLTGWLDKLESYRTDLAGFQMYWSEWDAYRDRIADFFRDYDVLICPAYAHAALPHGTSTEDACFRAFSHTMAWNLAGAPAAVVRCGETPDRLPLAVQIVARPWEDDLALAVAQRLEEAFGGWKPPIVQ
jgi:amidase